MTHKHNLSYSSYISTSTMNNNECSMSRELQQTYVGFFKMTLKSRTKALSQYTNTRYPATHKKYWRDIFLFMSHNQRYMDRDTFKLGIDRCGIKIKKK
eukprot:318393_1